MNGTTNGGQWNDGSLAGIATELANVLAPSVGSLTRNYHSCTDINGIGYLGGYFRDKGCGVGLYDEGFYEDHIFNTGGSLNELSFVYP